MSDPFATNYSSVDADAANKDGGSRVNIPGMYHFMIDEVEVDLETHKKDKEGNAYESKPHVTLTLTVVHSVEGQSPEGAKYWHRINLKNEGGQDLDDKQLERLGKQWIRLGLMKNVDGVMTNADGTPGKSPTQLQVEGLKGHQVIGKIDHEKERTATFNGKERTFKESWRINFGNIWPIDDEFVKDVPKNKELLTMASAATPPPAQTAEFGSDF